jgi:hypothetical protein
MALPSSRSFYVILIDPAWHSAIQHIAGARLAGVLRANIGYSRGDEIIVRIDASSLLLPASSAGWAGLR